MRMKTIQLLHYITGLGILVSGAIHLVTVFLLSPYEESMSFDGHPFSVIAVYRNLFLAASLQALLVFTAFHGFNGLRTILSELHQGRTYLKLVNIAVLLAALIVVIYGTRTIVIAHLLGNL